MSTIHPPKRCTFSHKSWRLLRRVGCDSKEIASSNSRIMYDSTVGATEIALKSALFASSRLAPTTKMVNQNTAERAQPTCMPPIWKTLAHIRRKPRGVQVGTDVKNLNNRLITGSDRIKIATHRFEAVAVATDESGYLPRLM